MAYLDCIKSTACHLEELQAQIDLFPSTKILSPNDTHTYGMRLAFDQIYNTLPKASSSLSAPWCMCLTWGGHKLIHTVSRVLREQFLNLVLCFFGTRPSGKMAV